MREELARSRTDYPAEWEEFGDLTEAQLLSGKAVANEPTWYTASFPNSPKPIRSIKALAHALGYAWEYDVTYDALWSGVTPTDWTAGAGRFDLRGAYLGEPQ
jgi:hypothetical protein